MKITINKKGRYFRENPQTTVPEIKPKDAIGSHGIKDVMRSKGTTNCERVSKLPIHWRDDLYPEYTKRSQTTPTSNNSVCKWVTK